MYLLSTIIHGLVHAGLTFPYGQVQTHQVAGSKISGSNGDPESGMVQKESQVFPAEWSGPSKCREPKGSQKVQT